ncbi:MAG: O-GlcNAc transferase [Verrucomicrobiota bacterium]
MKSPDAPANKLWLGALGIFALVVLAYLPVVHCGFIWDDDDYVTQNLTLRSLDGLRRIWFEVGATPQYYPLVHTTFWLEHALWGFTPLGFHVVNVLLHALGAVLLWRVLEKLRLPGAWLAAALWAVHPINVESVAWVTERKNVLGGVFYFAATLAWWRAEAKEAEVRGQRSESREQKSKGKGRKSALTSDFWPLTSGYYFVALALFVCALCSKTVACSLPAAWLVVAWWRRGRVTRADVLPLLPFFAVGLGLGLLTAHVEKTGVGAVGADWDLSVGQRILIAGRALCFYAGKLGWPTDFIFIYPRWVVSTAEFWQWIFPAPSPGVVVALWFFRERIGRGPLAAALIFGGTLFPALGFFNVYPMLYSFVADHFQYLAGVSLLALAATALHRLARGSRILLALPVLIAVLTWSQIGIYRNLETLWRDTTTRNPSCWMAWNNLGLELKKSGDARTAERYYRQALALRPGYTEAVNNLAALGLERGQLDDVVTSLGAALQKNPHRADLLVNYGTALGQLGRADEAQAIFQRALALNPDYVEALNNLGSLFAGQKKFPAAVEQFQHALRLQPDDPTTLLNFAKALQGAGDLAAAEVQFKKLLAVAPEFVRAHRDYAQFLADTGRAPDAIAHYREVLRLQPRDADAHYNLGCLHQAAQQLDAALAEFTAALDCRPDYAEAHNNLGVTLAAMGRFSAALPHLERAVALSPDYFRAHSNLAFVLGSLGRRDEAIAHLRQALKLKPDFAQARNQLQALGVKDF